MNQFCGDQKRWLYPFYATSERLLGLEVDVGMCYHMVMGLTAARTHVVQ